MTDLSPKWAFKIYAKLWSKYKDKEFSKEDAIKIVKDNNLNQAFSRLKKDKWLKISLDEDDSRKSLYRLKNPEEMIKALIEEYK